MISIQQQVWSECNFLCDKDKRQMLNNKELLTGRNTIFCKYLQLLTAIDDILSQQT